MAARRLRNGLELFLSDGEVQAPVRAEIGASWDRSVRSGLLPDRFEAQFDSTFNSGGILLRGERASTIATALYLSPSTVRNHLTMVFRKFGVHSQMELIQKLRALPEP